MSTRDPENGLDNKLSIYIDLDIFKISFKHFLHLFYHVNLEFIYFLQHMRLLRDIICEKKTG